jgi:hypothetical protein
MAATMKVSTGKGTDAVSVEVALPNPTTFDDPQWKRWGMDEADICAAAVQNVRVLIANGGARKELRKAVRRKVTGDALVNVVQDFVAGWTKGRSGASKRVIDLRAVPGMKQAQLDAVRAENPGAEVLAPEGLK